MAKKIIRTGTTADPTGDSLKNAFVKVNDNFTELYNALGLDADTLNIGAFEFAGSTMTTTDSSAIVIDQAATITSNLSVGGDILPQTANGGDLGSSTLPWKSLYVSNNTIYIGGTAVGLDANGNLTVNGGQVNTPSSTLVNGAYTASLGSDGSLTLPPTGTLSAGTIYFNGSLQTGSQTQYQFEAIVTGEGEEAVYSSKLSLPNIAEIFAGEDLSLSTWGSELAVRVRNPSDFSDHTWSFNNNGSLTLPGALTFPSGGGNIRSEGNINIDINLADSTLRRWQFGEDGNLTLPSGGNISEGGGLTGNAIKLTPAGGANANQALLIYPTGFAEGDHIHLTAGGGSTELYLGDDDHYVKLASNGFVVIKADDGVNGAVWGFSPDGTTSIPGDIKSDSNINIDINLSDSTLRRWSFGEDGNLETPGGIQVAGILKIDNGVHEKFQTKADATGIVTHDCSLGHIFYHTSPDALFTVNFTNLNLSSGYATALTLIIVQGGTGFIPNSVGIGGVIQTLNWQGNVTPTPSTNRTDVVTFSIINNSGTYTVLGQLTGF